jgi:hypothetical protein
MNYKVTKKEYEYFKTQFLKWADLLGVKDWEFFFTYGRVDEEKDYRACIFGDPDNRLVAIYFDPEWDIKPHNRELSMVAFHEVCEVLFSDLRNLLPEKVNDAFGRREIHKIIRILENTMFEKYWGKAR